MSEFMERIKETDRRLKDAAEKLNLALDDFIEKADMPQEGVGSIQGLTFRDVNIFQLLDGDGEPAGLVATTASMDEVDEALDGWDEYLNSNNEVRSADIFAEFLLSKGYPSERVFVEDEITI